MQIYTGVLAVAFMSNNTKKGCIWPDAKGGTSNKEVSACGDDGKRAVMMYNVDLPKYIHNSAAKCFP